MKIGDRVYVYGYVDEIRNDVIIIRNRGGYFGTDKSEVLCGGTCESCGRNADNGGFYETDNRTKCPIQEHYALPKDGRCHLYEPTDKPTEQCANNAQSDLISRAEAIEAVRICVEENSDFVIPNIYRAISEIPSVETWMSYRDLISRFDAIDKAKEIIYPLLDDMDYDDTASMAHVCIAMKIKILDMLHALPSAEQVTSKLKNPCDSLLTEDSENSKEQKSKLDLISRESAIEVVKGCRILCDYTDTVIKALNELPSAEKLQPRVETSDLTAERE